ncbi:MAG: DNA repair protein RadC [Elusimicrobiales bacterium]|nr:DNA repair protein RadC [Elusimicrobiales bacterium]
MDEKQLPSYHGHRTRLRAKFRETGLDSFLDHEALELLLTYAIPRKDTKPAAWALLKRFGSLSGVLDAKPEEIREIPGIGTEAAYFLSFSRALIRRYFLDELKQRAVIANPEDAVNYCRASLEGEKCEIFEVIHLNARNTVIACERVAEGTIDRAAISPRKVVENALARRAAAMIFVHNHPSGNPSPSAEDIEITRELREAAAVLGIKVYDHIIIGKGGYFSFKARGLLKTDEAVS